MDATAVDFVSVTVSDLEESVPFYRDTLGLTPEYVDYDMGWAEFAAPPTTIAMGEDSEGMPISPGAGGTAISLAVDDVEAAAAAVRENGAEVPMDAMETPVCDMAMVGDPDGNPIILHRRHDGTRGRRDPFPE